MQLTHTKHRHVHVCVCDRRREMNDICQVLFTSLHRVRNGKNIYFQSTYQ